MNGKNLKRPSWKKRAQSIFLCLAMVLSLFATSGTAYAYTNAFEFDSRVTFDSYVHSEGWDMSKVENPPPPTVTWRSAYGADEVNWHDANQVQTFFDGGYGTTTSFVWGLENNMIMPSGSGNDIVARAQSQMNLPEYQRIEIPDKSNHVGYVDWFLGGPPSDYSPWHWCCIFVMWCAEGLGEEYAKRGEDRLFRWTASCTVQYNYMIGKGYPSFSVRSAWNNREPVMPGDLIFFKDTEHSGWGHIGIVEEVGPNNSYIQTIEGNTSGAFNPFPESRTEGVHRQRYTKDSNYTALQMGIIVRPPYPKSETPEEGAAS